MARFRFHWRDGKTSDGDGKDVADAFTRLGYGAGAVAALDYHEELPVLRKTEPHPKQGKGGDE